MTRNLYKIYIQKYSMVYRVSTDAQAEYGNAAVETEPPEIPGEPNFRYMWPKIRRLNRSTSIDYWNLK